MVKYSLGDFVNPGIPFRMAKPGQWEVVVAVNEGDNQPNDSEDNRYVAQTLLESGRLRKG